MFGPELPLAQGPGTSVCVRAARAVRAPVCWSACITIRFPAGARSGYSLQLLGPLVPAFQQGMHQLDHPSLGPLVLFLTPIAREAQGMRYEIIFN